MKPVLWLCIPTYDRLKILRRSLSYHLPLCMKHGIGIAVSDNASDDGTFEFLVSLSGEYEHFVYRKSEATVSSGNNFNLALQLGVEAGAQFCWLLGDDDFVDDTYLSYLVKNLSRENVQVVVVNTKKQISRFDEMRVEKLDEILVSLGWHITFISSLILSANVIRHGFVGPDNGFEHVSKVLNYLARHGPEVLVWLDAPMIFTLRLGGSLPSWYPRLLEVFCENWVQTIRNAPNEFSADAKSRCIKALWQNSKIVNWKSIVFLTWIGRLHFDQLVKERSNIVTCIGCFRFSIVCFAACIPNSISRPLAEAFWNRFVSKRVTESSRIAAEKGICIK